MNKLIFVDNNIEHHISTFFKNIYLCLICCQVSVILKWHNTCLTIVAPHTFINF